MSSEHVVWEGARAPITLDVTCSTCWRVWHYDVLLTTVVNQLLVDEGWTFPEDRQVCPHCQK